MKRNFALGFVGSGKMCEAIVDGILSRGPEDLFPEIIATGPRMERGNELRKRYEITTSTRNGDAAGAELLVITVKPQSIDTVLRELRGTIPETTTVISIVAGIPMQKIADGLQVRKVVRAMPNSPGRIGEGVTVWTCTDQVRIQRRKRVTALLKTLGQEIFVGNEVFIDMATAVSGTGPAIVFHLIEKYIESTVAIGMPWHLARELTLATFRGSVRYAEGSTDHIAQLRNDVTSPAGTTAAALYELERGQVGTSIADALQAAYSRAQQLGK